MLLLIMRRVKNVTAEEKGGILPDYETRVSQLGTARRVRMFR